MTTTRPPDGEPPVRGEARAGEPSTHAAKFTTGSMMRHVIAMTAAGSVGLMAVFFVDLLSLLYVSRLGAAALTAAVGYASQVLFFLISVNIGLSIAVSALVSRALGAGDLSRARAVAASGLVHAATIAAVSSLLVWPFARDLLALFGARGEVLDVGSTYLRMTLPATVFLSVGMVCAGILRALGDAKRAMYVTLGGALVTACLDPIFIFGLHLGIYGAAIVLVLSRLCILAVGLRGVIKIHDLVARPRAARILADLAPMMTIAVPAVLTNIASPFANIYAMRVLSRFGHDTVAAFAIIDRLTPVVFGVLLALSGSVGPIVGQCFGAGQIDRVRLALNDSLIVVAVYVAGASVLLWLGTPLIVIAFGATGETARLLRFFCAYGGVLWLFLGGIFVANAAYNNLNAPFLSAVFNWGRATLGTIPFVTIGAAYDGAEGGYLGMILGAALFGTFSVGGSYIFMARLAKRVQRGGAAVVGTRNALKA